jgi:hypothetical protein
MNALMRVYGLSVALCLVFGGCSDDDDETHVEFFTTACPAVDACGGDPTGTWAFVSGCVVEPSEGWCDGAADRARGFVEGTFTFEGTSVTYEIESRLYVCAWVTESDSSGGGTVDLDEGRVMLFGDQTYDFCVDGDVLLLSQPGATDPEFATLRLERR